MISVKVTVVLDVDVHPLTEDPARVPGLLLHILRRNLSVGDAAWFTCESDETRGKAGNMFRIRSAKAT